MLTIVLDPGHGGPSKPAKVGGSSWNNATGPTGLLEKAVTLQVAMAAAAELASIPARVLLTRTTDVNIGIAARAGVAKSAGAEVFVSIHFNAPDPDGPAAQGTETWIDPQPRAQSRRLAEAVQSAVVKATGYRDRKVKNDILVSGVVKNDNHSSKTAHCLVEMSFLQRAPAEEARLRTEAYITQLGRAVRDGIVAYCRAEHLLGDEEAVWVASATGEAEDAASARALGLFAETRGAGAGRYRESTDWRVSDDAANVCEAAGEGTEVSYAEANAGFPDIDRTESTTHKSGRDGADIDHIVIHYTTSRNIEGTIRHFKTGSPRTSAHYIIGRDGLLVQMVPDDERAWHAGNSAMNARSIGIEHVAARGDAITEAQSAKSIALIRGLMERHGIPFENIIPHVCIKPTSCCGDLFKRYGGGADLSCEKQKAALRAWLAENGIGGSEAVRSYREAAPLPARDYRESMAEETAPETRTRMGQAIVNFEARRDSQRRIKVYSPPGNDGGGAFEVAGINVHYHHDEAWTLRRLIEDGKHAQAEALAVEYIAQYTDVAASWCGNDGVEFYLRDCVFNRGPRGAAKILQRALHVPVDGLVGSVTKDAVREAEQQSVEDLLDRLRAAREAYEREDIGYRKNFWEGLTNRWNNALKVARTFL